MNSRAIIVLGMHRSGTSLAAGCLAKCGVDFGPDLLPADDYNQTGYWEHREIVALHDELLACWNQSWQSTHSLPGDWENLPETLAIQQRIIDVLRRDFTGKPLWGFKDPRQSRLLPMWDRIFKTLDVEPLMLWVLRSPHEVADSLIKRDGLEASVAYDLWLTYNLDLWAMATDRRELYRCTYDDFLISPAKTCEAIFKAFALPTEIIRQRSRILDRFAKPGLKHNRVHAGNSLWQEFFRALVQSSPRAEQFRDLLQPLLECINARKNPAIQSVLYWDSGGAFSEAVSHTLNCRPYSINEICHKSTWSGVQQLQFRFDPSDRPGVLIILNAELRLTTADGVKTIRPTEIWSCCQQLHRLPHEEERYLLSGNDPQFLMIIPIPESQSEGVWEFTVKFRLLTERGQLALAAEKVIQAQKQKQLSDKELQNINHPTAPRRKLEAVNFHIDSAPKWWVVNGRIHIAGWFLDGQGNSASKIFARIGRNIVGFKPQPRPDLEQFFPDHSKISAEAGFQESIKTGGGFKYITIEAETANGEHHVLWKKLLWVRKTGKGRQAPDYLTWLAHPNQPQPRQTTTEGPLISILLPVYNAPEQWLRMAIESVINQSYPNWQLCIANDASTAHHVRDILDSYAADDQRIVVTHREKNGHISAASNTALDLCKGSYVALLDHDDELTADALSEIAAAIQQSPAVRVLYSDEDKIDTRGKRFSPYFKPDWNPDLLRSQNYFCHLSVYQTSLLSEVGGFRLGFEGAQDWDLALRATERVSAHEIVHIPKVLYHWRAIPGSTALSQSQKNYHQDAAFKALTDHITRSQLNAEVIPVKGGHWRLKYPIPQIPPLVTLIIPTRNGLHLLRPCLECILNRTSYLNYDVLIIDNGSDDPDTIEYLRLIQNNARVEVLRDEGPFNYSALNNRAVRKAKGEIIALINNDIEPINSDWLDEMVAQACRPEIGAVGALLYYPNDTVQHAGIILGIAGSKIENGVAGHAFKTFKRGHNGNMNRLRLLQNYSAVTAACLVIRKSTYEQVGGLDEENLPVSFNDVDFCLRVREAGYRNVWTPFAELYHHESASRGKEDSPAKIARAHQEEDYMRKRWGDFLDNDPAYNPNLTLVHEDFSLAWPPRKLTLPSPKSIY